MTTPLVLYGKLQTMLRAERESDRRLALGRNESGAEEVRRPGRNAVEMWWSLQSSTWSNDAANDPLHAAMQQKAVESTVATSVSNESALWDASVDEKRSAWAAAVRQVAFVGILKQVLLHGAAERFTRLTSAGCGVPAAVAEGNSLQARPLLEMTVSDLLAQVRLLRAAHGVLTGEARTLDYLTGLLWRVAMEVVLTQPSHADSEAHNEPRTSSLLALSAQGSREKVCQQLLAEAEAVFAGLVRDCGTCETLPLRIGTNIEARCEVPAERVSRAQLIMEKLTQITNRKQMQRAIIVARESLLSTVLCPYGKERAKRHELLRSGRKETVALYDRMSYKSLRSMLDDNALVRAEVQDALACVHAATFATCQVALREECHEWMERQVRWHAWPSKPVETLHLQRVFTELVDSEGEHHNNLLYFLAKSSLRNPELAPFLCS